MKDQDKSARIKLLISRIVAYTVLIFLSILCLFFFYLLIVNASRSDGQLDAGFTLIPSTHFFENLKNAWNDGTISIPTGMKNSLIVSLCTALLSTYFSALTAYGVYAYQFRLKKFVFGFILAVMMIPSQVGAVGFVQLCYKFKLTNKLWVLIAPSVAAPAVFFYMMQYLKATLPLEMVEASRIDGSGEFATFNRIVLPLMKPALAVQMIFSFVNSWNDFFMPGLLLSKLEKQTVPIMISTLRSADYTKFDMGKVYMLILLSILPVIIVYIFLSKSIIKGVTSGSVKG